MKTLDAHKATMDERFRCLTIVDRQPEMSGEIPEAVWKRIANDRRATTDFVRNVVRLTKQGIRDRING